jgi:hypothetical protein
MGAEISFAEMWKEETLRVVRADGTRPIKSQRFLFHQKRRIEASDQLARKRWQACWVPSGEQKLDIRKRSQLQRARADATATIRSTEPSPRKLGPFLQKCSKSVQGTF